MTHSPLGDLTEEEHTLLVNPLPHPLIITAKILVPEHAPPLPTNLMAIHSQTLILPPKD